MAEDRITPEEKLLKIIEGPKSQGKSKFPFLPGKEKQFKVGLSLDFVKNILHIDKEKLKYINLGSINKVLIAFCVLITSFLVFDFVRSAMNFSKRLKSITEGNSGLGVEKKLKYSFNIDLSEALAMTKKRNIFSFLPPKPPVDLINKNAEISQLVANLKLVGILWSATPQAMIEDNKEKKTYLLATGEKIGELVIKSILRDKVIIAKGDQQWDLR